MPFVLPTVRPTRVDTLNYYLRVARHFGLDIETHERVTDIRRRDAHGFVVHTATGKEIEGAHVVIATGYYDQPVRLGISGEDLPHVLHYYDEPFRYAGMHVVVVGGRNSAVETALDLYRHDAHVTLVHRGTSLSAGVKYWIQPDCENRIKAGQIRAVFGANVRSIVPGTVTVATAGGEQVLAADYVFVMAGFGPDSVLLRRAGVDLDPQTLAPMLSGETFETNVPGLFVAGSVVAGKNTNTIFVENGRLHGDTIARAILARRSRIS